MFNSLFFSCWMKVEAFYWAFALPVGLICLCNLTVFIVTIVSICRRPSGLRSNQSKQKLVIANLQAAITSFILLGELKFYYICHLCCAKPTFLRYVCGINFFKKYYSLVIKKLLADFLITFTQHLKCPKRS